jgi:hypothetical protein
MAELYRINTATGHASDLGSTGVPGVAGSAYVNGRLQLYQYDQIADYIYSAPAGSTTFARGARLTTEVIDGGVMAAGLAAVLTPEPQSALLAGLGIFCIVLGRRSSRRLSPRGRRFPRSA